MSDKVIIIAEAGVNHNGDYGRALRLADEARKAGADYVKYQTAQPELVISRYAPKAKYQVEQTGDGESQLDMCRAIHLPLSAYKDLKAYCDGIGIRFISTPFDLLSIDTLKPLGMDFWKIPSGEITNYPYLRAIAQLGQPVVMSTGMSTMEDIEAALKVLTNNGLQDEQITLLHCNTEYPTPYRDVNLRAMATMRDAFGLKVGYSDHTQGIEVALAAVALGACVIEKHFTLSRQLPGPDHKASLEPDELADMVRAIRHIEQSLGNGVKQVTPSEKDNMVVARKSLIAKRFIRKGEVLGDDNLTTKRPGNGISPMRWDEVAGTRAVRDFEEDELIEL